MRKTAEDQKRELVDELAVARRSLLETVGAFPAERLDEVFLGTWSVKDLLAHLVGWDTTNLQAIQEILAGQYPTFFNILTGIGKATTPGWWSNTRKIRLRSCWRRWKGRTITIRNLLRAEASDERQYANQIK